jgi:RimJ/RimL family protein N-acetyltransferase
MPVFSDVALRKPRLEEAESLYQLMIGDEKWTKFDGPYFGYTRPSFEEFKQGLFKRLQAGQNALAIAHHGRLVGCVTCYWQDEKTRWLEAGLSIYDSTLWNRGVGRRALIPWITFLFETHEIERVGLTTWSGNPGMVRCAQAIGFQVEGVLRQVRYFQGTYYDSIKLGVLRSEWAAFLADLEEDAGFGAPPGKLICRQQN